MTRVEIMEWRRTERRRLLEARRDISPRDRHAFADRIAERVLEVIGPTAGRIVSAYWPIRAEPNLLPLLRRLDEAGNRGALPVVVEKGAPLVFRSWRDGEPLEPGVWNIPVPMSGEAVVPDVVLAPVVGFDPACYRLGYGGGFFDRTLASLSSKPLVIGVGYAQATIPTIHPLPHDIAMDLITTERAVHEAATASSARADS